VSIRLSSETLHASCVALDGRAVLITGISGSGKSDLSLRLLDRGFVLVADDQTIVRKQGERLIATAPVALLVELTSSIQRMPDDLRSRPVLGVSLPLISVDALTASAASKVSLALDRLGLKV
jgi:ABC-type thiamine transport system ATPase subunit